jgi:hypothetical protein
MLSCLRYMFISSRSIKVRYSGKMQTSFVISHVQRPWLEVHKAKRRHTSVAGLVSGLAGSGPLFSGGTSHERDVWEAVRSSI